MLTVHAHINSKCMCIQFLVVNKIYICCPNITFENKLLFSLQVSQQSSLLGCYTVLTANYNGDLKFTEDTYHLQCGAVLLDWGKGM